MKKRRFVLQPLHDLAPSLVVAGSGATVHELLDRLGDGQRVQRLAPSAISDDPSRWTS
jgi:7,8-dihydro-6-hydroxymethylpterin-pyrophosphokinase